MNSPKGIVNTLLNPATSCPQILHQLIHLGKVWKGILPKDIYSQSLGALLDSVLQSMTEEVLQLEVLKSF